MNYERKPMSMRFMQIRSGWKTAGFVLGVGLALNSSAQVQTQTSRKSGASELKVSIDRGTVVSVQGNDLFVEMSDGSVRHFPSVPERAKVTVGNQQLGIHELKPGMKLERTTVTTTTPEVVTTVQTVSGRVVEVMPPSSVLLRLENGDIQPFNIPDGQKFMVDGKATDAFGLKKNMLVTATKVTEVPVSSVTKSTHLTGKLPPNAPVLVALPQGGSSASVTVHARITAIDKTNRDLTLKGPQGDPFTVHAGPEVKRFNDLKVGDQVSATYAESIAWSVRPAGQPASTSGAQAVAARRENGPGGGVASQRNVTVTVAAIDRAGSSVTVIGPQGGRQTIKVLNPQNLENLKVGDKVDITYTQAMLIRVDPVAG
jgi:hypothetical protein